MSVRADLMKGWRTSHEKMCSVPVALGMLARAIGYRGCTSDAALRSMSACCNLARSVCLDREFPMHFDSQL